MLHVVIGLILLVLGIFGVISWWSDFGLVLRGAVPFVLVIAGLVAAGSGLSKANLGQSEGEPPDAE